MLTIEISDILSMIVTIFCVFVGGWLSLLVNKNIEKKSILASLIRDVSIRYADFVSLKTNNSLASLIAAIDSAKIFADKELFSALNDLKTVVLSNSSSDDIGAAFSKLCLLARNHFN